MDDSLDLFHPAVAGWFRERFGGPTAIQALAWREIAAGSHILATAPTGSGKTLAAFLWAIDRLVTGAWRSGAPRVLYLSPLRALNNDIRRNLSVPLDGLGEYFAKSGLAFPEIRVMTRSGDTPPGERRLLYRRPPEILITTPESLNIMLTSKSGREIFTGLQTVILDEIHALAGSKRGTHLITAVERLTLLSGEFQRIALSATVRPLEAVADFIGGFELRERHGEGRYVKRPVSIVQSRDEKRRSIAVECPEGLSDDGEEDGRWKALARDMKKIIGANRSTLLFTKSRMAAEKMARFINEGAEEIIAYSHHGSIAREIRLEVEERMKRGDLRAIVATSSLELGIDIGELDEVILIETPFSISSALQRVGRAGHGVGETSRGRLFPTHGMDFLTAAVIARSIAEAGIEPIRPVDCPLDILAQVIVSMVCAGEWNIDALYAFFKTCHPYRDLPRRQFDLVIEMLAGRYADSRLKELSPRVSVDKIDNTARAKPGMAYLIYTSGGTIPDRGYFDLRVMDSHAKIGELDEEFVWERSVGDSFTLGPQAWRIQNITHNEVAVAPLAAKAGMVPFWKAEEIDRDFYYSEQILAFLKEADDGLSDPELFARRLGESYFMSQAAAAALMEFLSRQKTATAGALPHRGRVVIERYRGEGVSADGLDTVIHNFWGGRLNRPLAMALSAAIEKRYGLLREVIAGDANILLKLPEDIRAADAVRLVDPENLAELLRARLENTGLFGARFRINAARALLLPRGSVRRRYPLWLNRLRSKKLMETVARYPDFPILLETWRECFQDAFDLDNLKIMLDELISGRIECVEAFTDAPSPFCGGLLWRQTGKYMYADDTPERTGPTGLSRSILDEVLRSSSLRPRIPARLAEELGQRLRRVSAGYAPSSPPELLDWLRERLLIPRNEWEELLAACRRDSAEFPGELPEAVLKKMAWITLRGGTASLAAALENIPLVRKLFDLETMNGDAGPAGEGAESEMDRAGFLVQWLSYYGPVPRSMLEEHFGIRGNDLDAIIEEPAADGRIIFDAILENSAGPQICHADNLERLLRMARRDRRPSFKALPIDYLPLFLASYQGLTRPGETMDDLQKRLERLFGYPAEASLWEEDILPARMESYRSAWLDSLLHSGPLTWRGAGREAVTFALEAEAALFIAPHAGDLDRARAVFPDERGRYGLYDIARHAGLDTEKAANLLWDLAWKSAVTNDSMETLRRGILNGFTPAGIDPAAAASRPGKRRPGIGRWTASRPVQGTWRIAQIDDTGGDGVDRLELDKDRARILFDRYGILFRELLDGEPASMRWKRIFPVLRLMELSGEIMSGYFFEGIPGAQFISPDALRVLREGLDEDAVYWMNAKDPASPCGSGLDALKGRFPRRVPSNHLVFQGTRVILESKKNGSELNIRIPPDHPRLGESLGLFKTFLSRDFNPPAKVAVEKINGVDAPGSGYREALREFGFRADYRSMVLRRQY